MGFYYAKKEENNMAEENLRYYNATRKVPKEAIKPIMGGRLNGKSNINPMWRIEKLTELFGPVGEGWRYEILTPLSERFVAGANNEVAVMMDVALYYRMPNGEWSEPIVGTGGNMYIVNEKNGLRTDDDGIKKALTDALSVCCKAIGIGADVYWAEGQATDNTSKPQTSKSKAQTQPQPQSTEKPPVDDDLPEPKPAKEKAPSVPSEDEIEKAKKIVVPDGIEGFSGKTIDEIFNENPENLKAVYKATTDKPLRDACLAVYNGWANSKKAS